MSADESIRPAGNSYTGIWFNPIFNPPDLALDFTSAGFLKLNEVVVALTGVFARNGQLIGLSVDASDGRELMLPLIEMPRSARSLAFESDTLDGSGLYGWVFAQRFSADGESFPEGPGEQDATP